MIKNSLLMLTMVASLVWISSCSVDDIVEDAVNDLVETCVDVDTDCGDDSTYEYCFDTEGGSYTFEGTTYDCDGLDCDTALEEVLDAVEEHCAGL